MAGFFISGGKHMNEKRAFSLMKIKAVNEDTREITGIASTPEADRMGDIVEPEGAVFKLPIPLLWQHDHSQPIGQVTEAKVTSKGIEIKAKIAKIDEPSQLAARLEEAWQSIKSGLVRGLSIGFRPIEYSYIDDGGVRFVSWDWYELSAVTIPANANASIQTVKSLFKEHAATGNSSNQQKPIVKAGVSAKKTTNLKDQKNMNIQEQIKSFEAKRAADEAAREEIMTKAASEGRTLDVEESESYDNITAEIKSVDAHLSRLRDMEQAQIKSAKPVDKTPTTKAATENRGPAIVRTVKELEPGIGFARLALAMRAGKGNINDAKSFAEHTFGDDVRLNTILKAAVSAGTTTNANWAGNLVDYQNLSSEFIEFLRPRTIIGQFGQGVVPSLRRVPFNVRIPGKTAAGTASWVGEGYAKPVTSSGYEATELKWAKIAAISVITDELDRFSDPSVQTLVRDDLAEAVIERMDIDFINPAKAVGTGASASPASITNGVTAIASSGNDADAVRADIAALWAIADDTNLPTSSAVYITDTKTARSLAGMKNPLGNNEFPNLTVNGGSIDGIPVVISNYVPRGADGSLFILAFASEIYLADDGIVTIDVSREASILMDTTPNMDSGTPTAAQLVSMFQTNSLAIRAERYVNWKKRRPQAVAYLSKVNWGAASTGGNGGGASE